MKSKFLILISAIFLVSLFSILSVSASWNSSLNNGLVGYWNMSEGSGAIIHDATGQQVNGYLSTGSWITGVIGNGLQQPQILVVPLNQNFTQNSPVSIGFWAYHTTSVASELIGLNENYSSIADWQGFNLYWQDQGGGQWYLEQRIGSYNGAIGGTHQGVFDHDFNNDLGNWSYIVIVYNGTIGTTTDFNVQAYINGVLQNNINIVGNDPVVYNTNQFYIGGFGGGNPFGVSPLSYDEVSLWNRTLSQNDVNLLYNNGNGITYAIENESQNNTNETIVPTFNVTLDSPTPNQILTNINVLFECQIEDSPQLLNLTLIVDNSPQFTIYNTTGNQTDMDLTHGVIFSDNSTHNWTCTGFSKIWNNTATQQSFSIAVPVIPPTPTPSVTTSSLYDTFNSVGAGFGYFLQVISLPLFILLLVFAVVGIVVVIAYKVSDLIRGHVNSR